MADPPITSPSPERTFPPGSGPRRAIGDRLAAAEAREAAATAADGRIAGRRLLAFFAGIALVALGLFGPPVALAWSLLPFAAFGWLVTRHARAQRRLAAERRIVAAHRRSLARMDDRWSGEGPDGAALRPDPHLFADDLDLFGPGSLFQLLCSTRTVLGERTLARWLGQPPDAASARARAAAVAALAGDLALRERLAALGGAEEGRLDASALDAWARQAPDPVPDGLRLAALGVGLLGASTLAGWLFGGWGAAPFLATWAIGAATGLLWARRVASATRGVEAAAPGLLLLAELVELVRSAAPSLPGEDAGAATGAQALAQSTGRPAALVAALEALAAEAPTELRRLHGHANALVNASRNGVLAFVDAVLPSRLHRVHALEGWRARHSTALLRWMDAAGAFEALLSLAAYAFEHPDDTFAEVLDAGSPARFEAEALGHPLLPAADCVRNSLRLDGTVALLVVSGSNMSGKSTLLRAVGTAVVLAGCGAPVRAARLVTSPFALGASLSIHDSLREGQSRFFAEIARLAAVRGLTAGGAPVLFLFDELLSGTNSEDRRAGASAVLGALLDKGALGLVTTHDLALTAIAGTVGGRARNVHFEDRFEDGRLVFDYTLREGVVTHGNALALMRSLGLVE